ncbi:unnamed protein product [Effrenium voratum]|nr:unnamed protein product [Effrenium voratum]
MGCSIAPQCCDERFSSDAIIFAHDDHTSVKEEIMLARDLHKAAGGTLWLEFVYEEQLEEVRKAFATADTADDQAKLEELLQSISSNGWSMEFNKSLVHLLTVAQKHHIAFHALDDPEWSRDAFIAHYGPARGPLRYLANRASQLDDGEGATSRWCSKICARRATEREEQGPVVVLGGAEHGPPFHKFMKARINVEVTCIYEDLHGKHTTQQISSQLDTLNSEETRHSLQTLRSR